MIFSTIYDIIFYSYMVGCVISFIFFIVFIKSLLKKQSPLRSSFYFFMTLATLADLIGSCVNYIDRFLIYPLIGQSEEEKNQEFYEEYIYPIVMYLIITFIFLDFVLESRCCINYEPLHRISVSFSSQKSKIAVILL